MITDFHDGRDNQVSATTLEAINALGRMLPTLIASKVEVHSSELASLFYAEKQLVPAQKASPSERKRWVCVAGKAVFLVLVFTMRGRWDPRAARLDIEDHERRVAEEVGCLRRVRTSAATERGGVPSVPA